MLPGENHLFGFTWTKPSQSSVPVGLTGASDFGFCFQCQAGSSLVLHRPIEITLATGGEESPDPAPVRVAAPADPGAARADGLVRRENTEHDLRRTSCRDGRLRYLQNQSVFGRFDLKPAVLTVSGA
jgi:hypothetical protein